MGLIPNLLVAPPPAAPPLPALVPVPPDPTTAAKPWRRVGLLADACLDTGQTEEGLHTIAEALGHVAQTGEQQTETEADGSGRQTPDRSRGSGFRL
jgi:hypothetical protein